MDAGTAAKVGKQVGAGYVITGTFVDYYGRVRVDARLIDSGNAAILEVVSSGQRARAELPQMIADIAAQLMSGKHLPGMPAGAAASPQVSAEAFVLFRASAAGAGPGEQGGRRRSTTSRR